MNLQGKRAAIVTLGCKVNQYETDAMYGMLKEAGVTMVDPKEAADIYIVYTCSVTNMAERKSRQMLHRAKKKNPDVVVVAVGCYAQVGKEELSKDTNIDLIIGNNKKKDLIHILEEHMGEKESAAESIEVIDIAHDQEYESLHVEQLKEHTRAYIKVQDGCTQFCSYCIIPYARGRVRSRKMEEVLEEITNLTKHGCQEFVITGIHVTSYGKDLGDVTLIDLLEEIAKIPEVKRIRLGQINDQIKAKRSNILLEMSKQHQKEFETKQLGMVKEVLIEEKMHGKDHYYTGHTKEYIKVALYSEEPLENKIVKVKLRQILDDGYVLAEC